MANDDELQTPAVHPPDGATLAVELQCPLCEYNLFGLTNPRCPECGYSFEWAELIRAKKESHPYLFENHSHRNVWSFRQTYFSDCFPDVFWTRLQPAEKIKRRRLMSYWLLSILPLLFLIVFALVTNYRLNLIVYRFYGNFLRVSGSANPGIFNQLQPIWFYSTTDLWRSFLFNAAVEALLWPWITLVFLCVFLQSMSRAKIRKLHLLRVVIYGCDFSLLMSILIMIGAMLSSLSRLNWLLPTAVACSVLTQYRLYFAYSNYLRFHMPFQTVFTAQVLVLLVIVIVYFQTYSPW